MMKMMKMMKMSCRTNGVGWSRCLLLFQCLCLSLIVSNAVADTYPRQPGIDALNYVFRLTLSDDTDEIVGEATIDLLKLRRRLILGEFLLPRIGVHWWKRTGNQRPFDNR